MSALRLAIPRSGNFRPAVAIHHNQPAPLVDTATQSKGEELRSAAPAFYSQIQHQRHVTGRSTRIPNPQPEYLVEPEHAHGTVQPIVFGYLAEASAGACDLIKSVADELAPRYADLYLLESVEAAVGIATDRLREEIGAAVFKAQARVILDRIRYCYRGGNELRAKDPDSPGQVDTVDVYATAKRANVDTKGSRRKLLERIGAQAVRNYMREQRAAASSSASASSSGAGTGAGRGGPR